MKLEFIKKDKKIANVFYYQEFTKDDIDILNFYTEENPQLLSIEWLFSTNSIYTHIGEKNGIIYGLLTGEFLECLNVDLINLPFELLRLTYFQENKDKFKEDCKYFSHIEEYRQDLIYYRDFCKINNFQVNHECLSWIE